MAYTDKQRKDIVDKACKEIAEEGKSLRSILLDSALPDRKTFFVWIDNDKEKRNQYARAMQDRADFFAEEILEIADTQNADAYVELETDRVVIDGQAIQRSKLMVDTRKWLMGKMNPKKYGEAQLLKIADNEGDKLEVNAMFNVNLLKNVKSEPEQEN